MELSFRFYSANTNLCGLFVINIFALTLSLDVYGANSDEDSPRVKRLEGSGRSDVVDEDAAVGSAVERDAQRLESLLAADFIKLFFTLS
jgi:hypothetical protein